MSGTRRPDIEAEMARIFQELKDVEEEKQPLDVEGRVIPYRKRAGGLVWFDFAVLCGGPRSYADYVDLARALPHRDPVRRAENVAEERRFGAPLHLAGGRVLR